MGGKSKKKAVEKPVCECPTRCECGRRPERPSHGHKWDAAQQAWVGRGAREQRVAAKLSDTGPRETAVGMVETWQKLPSTLIHEWCQKEKRPKPKWYGNKLVLPDKRPDKSLVFCFKGDQPEALAKETAALLALQHVQGNLPLERKLPEPFKSMWGNVEAASDFASRADRAAHKREQAARERTRANEREARDRALAKVYMARRVREVACLALGIDDYGDDDGDAIGDLDDESSRLACAHVIALGFAPHRALVAMKATDGTVDGMLAWLCLHTGEDDLPDSFDPDGSNLDVIAPTTKDVPVAESDARRVYKQALDVEAPFEKGELGDDAIAEIEALQATFASTKVYDVNGFGRVVDVPEKRTLLLVPFGYPESAPAAAVRSGASEATRRQLAALAVEPAALYDLCEHQERPSLLVEKKPPLAKKRQPQKKRSSWWDRPGVLDVPKVKATYARQRLPAAQKEAEVVRLVDSHRVVLVQGGTGCGKTTQIPQFLLDAADGPKKIVVAQPRRLAAVGVAARVAEERREALGDTVGCMVRGESKTSEATALLFCTTGVLLQRLRSDPGLKHVSHVVVDEVHERNVDADVLLSLLKHDARLRHVKVILMSATLDARKFIEYFDNPGTLDIPGFAYPVDVFYTQESPLDVTRRIAADQEAVLIFVASIAAVSRLVQEMSHDEELAPRALHGSLSPAAQRQAFEPSPKGKVKVVVSTNVAETSVTIPDVTAVIDTCRANVTGYDAERDLPRLYETWIAKDAANQRKGRAGRVRRGVCYRLVAEEFFESLSDHSTPEIERVSLEPLCVQAMAMSKDPASFAKQLLDPPANVAVVSAMSGLKEMGACDDASKLTPLGAHIAALPCAARLGKLIILGAVLGVRDAALSVAAGLSVRSVWRTGVSDRAKVDATKQQLRKDAQCGRSDHALMALAYETYVGKPRHSCDEAGVSHEALREMRQLRRQLDLALNDLGFVTAPFPYQGAALWRVVRAVVVAALYPRVLKIVKPKQKYAESASGAVAVDAQAKELRFFRREGDRVFLHPASSNFKERTWTSPWAVYSDCADIHGKVTVRDTSEAAPYALLLFGGAITPLVRESHVTVDAWIRFNANPRVAAIITALRSELQAFLLAKIDDPSLTSPVTTIMLRLLLYDGLS